MKGQIIWMFIAQDQCSPTVHSQIEAAISPCEGVAVLGLSLDRDLYARYWLSHAVPYSTPHDRDAPFIEHRWVKTLLDRKFAVPQKVHGFGKGRLLRGREQGRYHGWIGRQSGGLTAVVLIAVLCVVIVVFWVAFGRRAWHRQFHVW